MTVRKMFEEIGNYLIRKDKWQRKNKNSFLKKIGKDVYVYMYLKYGEYITIGYNNAIMSFDTFSTDDDDYEMELTAEFIYDIAAATQIIAKNYSNMLV